jgi:hypothetical protein
MFSITYGSIEALRGRIGSNHGKLRSASRIVALQSEGLPFVVTPQGHRFDLHASMRWYVQRKVERKTAPVVETDGAPLELARRQGEVVSIDATVAAVGAHVTVCRSRLLSLPARLGPAVAVEDNAAQGQKIFEAGIYEALEELDNGGIEPAGPARRQGLVATASRRWRFRLVPRSGPLKFSFRRPLQKFRIAIAGP